MCTVNDKIPRNCGRDVLRGVLLPLALVACAFGMPSSAGQASTTFRVTINVPAPIDSCTAAVDEAGRPLVNCHPVVVVGGAAAPAAGGLQAYRLPDVRMKLVGALVEDAQQSLYPWGEYSSRLVEAGPIEYLEMTVAW